jgi:hypothetical protein
MPEEKENTITVTAAAGDLEGMKIPVSIEKETVIIIKDDTDEIS